MFCTHFQLGKSYKLSFVNLHMRSHVPFFLLFLDLWTSPTVSSIGVKYYLAIIDDFYNIHMDIFIEIKRSNYLHFYIVYCHE